MTSDNNTLLGLQIEMPPEDWTPVKACGSLVCLDADGNLDTWHFQTDGLAPYEAMGLLAEHQAILSDAAPYIYFNIEGVDDDD